MPRLANHNTSALSASLQSTLPTMRAEAQRLIRAAIESHATKESAAKSLGMNARALNRLEELLHGTRQSRPGRPPKTATKKTAKR